MAEPVTERPNDTRERESRRGDGGRVRGKTAGFVWADEVAKWDPDKREERRG